MHHLAKPKSSPVFMMGYLTVSITLPFILSYRESTHENNDIKGFVSARSLFNKI
ncbi:hypothetical protein CLIB1423_01S05754 [[Candida] railenensis]|uniref:Uncharacterized protein n=1 Tax=[Candida] railenensis TaxID=45579 RepID=A0A9P0QKC0_9ASCO|nr:hypothetical protein CLIB1423_01S05754 [[Candida] railenensis]